MTPNTMTMNRAPITDPAIKPGRLVWGLLIISFGSIPGLVTYFRGARVEDSAGFATVVDSISSVRVEAFDQRVLVVAWRLTG